MAWAPVRVSNAAKRSKPTRIHAMHFVYKNRTGQPWPCAGHPRLETQTNSKTWMAGTPPGRRARGGHDDVESRCKGPLVSVVVMDVDRLLGTLRRGRLPHAAAVVGATDIHVGNSDLHPTGQLHHARHARAVIDAEVAGLPRACVAAERRNLGRCRPDCVSCEYRGSKKS